MNFETLNEPRAEIKVQALVDTGKHTSTSRERYSCLNTPKVEAEVFFDIHAESLAEEKVQTLPWTLAEVNAKALSKTLADMVAVVKVKTVAERLANVEAKAVVDALANTLAQIHMNTVG